VIRIYSIGFTQTTAEGFFTRLVDNGVERVVDVRLNTTSQLAGFAKGRDLPYFLEVIAGIGYRHEPLLCPTPELLAAVKQRKALSWAEFERAFRALIVERRISEALDRSAFETPTALLCSEATADHCHRRLVLEHLAERWGDVEAAHL
jgi:uncharacterized protein (DUF488 family)